MVLTKEEILLLLNLLAEKHGRGYSEVPEVARLQAKLSIMLQVKSLSEAK